MWLFLKGLLFLELYNELCKNEMISLKFVLKYVSKKREKVKRDRRIDSGVE